jgi:hypothetical protein
MRAADDPDAPERWEWVERSPSSGEHGEADLVAGQGALLAALGVDRAVE